MQQHPLVLLLDLSRRARSADSVEELVFLLVNDTHSLTLYRQAGLWFESSGVKALSGVVQLEANAPFVQWLDRACRHLHDGAPTIRQISSRDLPAQEAAEWSEWLPEYGLWLPIPGPSGQEESEAGGLLLAGDTPWSEESIALLQEWIDVWRHAWFARHVSRNWSWRESKKRLHAWLAPNQDVPWWKQRRTQLAALATMALLFPVRLTVLAHGELVPANPAVIRAPVDGVIGQFHVQPNQTVKAGQPLFGFDEAPIAARLEVAAQAQATAEAEYRQFEQAAVSDSKSKSQLALLLGKIEEKRAEADYLRGQLERSRVLAPQDGIAVFDDPSEWIGKPVQTGERIMRISASGDVEVEAWIPVADAIPLPADAPVSLYLSASPLSSVSARIRYLAHDSVLRPDGSYAYRLRAKIEGGTSHRIGLKGTAKIYGDWVPLVYWILRRPLAVVRQTLGV